MVIAVGGCDNVEWGGIDIGIVPPPEKAGETADADSLDALPDGPVLFYVNRGDGAATVIPVGHVTDHGLTAIVPGQDLEDFGARFIASFLGTGTELALFRRGQRVGTLTVDSAGLPAAPVCRPLPRATGRVSLDAGAQDAPELLALQVATAPESRTGSPEAERRMEVVADMLAGEMLQAREARVASPAAARRQLLPFPLADSPDPGFTATYLVDDSLDVGGDDQGAALFVVFTPLGQTGYDTAFVGFADYARGGKAAPRVVDFLDWDRDGAVELLLEVAGTHASWFRAVGLLDEEWGAVFEDQCDPRTAPVDTAPGVRSPEQGQGAIPAGQGQQARPSGQPEPRQTPARSVRMPDLDSMAIIEPRIQLSNPQAEATGEGAGRDTVPPDTGSTPIR